MTTAGAGAAITTAATTITKLLESGVPTGPIAQAFNLTQQTVKDLQAAIRVSRYGSSEISELMAGLMFEAYTEARNTLHNGSPSAKTRMIQMILARAMGLVGRQAPEEFERLRSEVQGLMGDIITKESSPSLSPNPTFSPIDIDTDTDTDTNTDTEECQG